MLQENKLLPILLILLTIQAKELPYNFNQLNEAASQRWAGLMRAISVSNFTQF